ncbi:hypothetical protein BC828DRAFT_383784 [Blastocladiella britannica]|nr:hypothetical protein BC828DRAFT_383784 [Blastocladiella britannica]
MSFTPAPIATISSDVLSRLKSDDDRKRFVIADAANSLARYAVAGLLGRKSAPNSNHDVYALVPDKSARSARDLEKLGAKLIEYKCNDPADIRRAFKEAAAPTLILLPPQSPDLVVRTAMILTNTAETVTNVIMWSSIGTEHADALSFAGGDNKNDDEGDMYPSALLLLKEAEELVLHGTDTATTPKKGNPKKRGHAPKVRRCVLRAGFPLQHFFALSPLIMNRGIIPFTSDAARIAWIEMQDMGRATADLLRSGALPEDWDGATRVLCAPESTSGPMLITAANEGLSHPLAFAKVQLTEMRAFLLQARMAPFDLSLAMGWWRLFDEGKLDVAAPELADLLGGPDRVTPIRTFFAENEDRFVPSHLPLGARNEVAIISDMAALVLADVNASQQPENGVPDSKKGAKWCLIQ